MTKINGTIILSSKYNSFFENGKFLDSSHTTIIEKNYFKYKKTNNIVYTIP